MQPMHERMINRLDWLVDLGIDEKDVRGLNPCVPGEFTLPAAYYVNSATPNVVYAGAEEGTLPLVAGRWYLLPSRLLDQHPRLRDGAVPVSRATRLIPA